MVGFLPSLHDHGAGMGLDAGLMVAAQGGEVIRRDWWLWVALVADKKASEAATAHNSRINTMAKKTEQGDCYGGPGG